MALTKITPQMFDTSAAGHDFNIDNGTFVVDASANRVGIGTTSPASPLTINGTDPLITFENGEAPHWQLGFENTQSDRFVIYDNNASSYRFIIDNSGRVGIGLTNPQFPLHVKSSSTDIAKFESSGSYTFTRFSSSSRNWAISAGSGFSIYDETASATQLSIDSSGNLTATGGVTATRFDATTASTTDPVLQLTDYGVADYDFTFPDTSTIQLGTSTSSDKTFKLLNAGSGTFNLNVEGNVGIGTSSPDSLLELETAVTNASGGLLLTNTNASGYSTVQFKNTGGTAQLYTIALGGSSSAFAQKLYIYDDTDSAARVILDHDGNVGIGESSPSAKLHVKKTAASTQHYDSYATAIIEDTEGRLQIVATDGGSNASALILTNEEKHWGVVNHGPGQNNTFGIGYYATSSSGTDIADALSSPFTITTGGNVGIGETSPGFPLHVTTTAENAAYIESSHNNGTFLWVSNSDATTGRTANLGFAPANNVAGAIIRAEAIEDFSTSANRTADLAFQVRHNGTLAERWRIHSDGPLVSGGQTPVHVGGTPADANFAEIGAGYINLARDDTADADQILFAKNGAIHSKLQTVNNAFVVHSEGLDIHLKTNQGGAARNINLSGSAASLKPFDSNNGQIDLGTAGAKWRSLYVNYLGPASDLRYLKGVYRKAVNVNRSFVAIFKVNGSALGSQFRFSVVGTTGNVVVNARYEILVNHSYDCTVQSLSGSYTETKVKIVSNANEDCTVYLAANTYNNATAALNFEVETYHDEQISFDVSSPHTTAHFIHTATAGENTTFTGAMTTGAGTTTGYS